MSTEVADQLRAGIERIPAKVPPGLARGAYRRYRRRRTAARAIAATGTAAVSALAATVALSGSEESAEPATQTTAYVVSHVTRALDAIPADSIMVDQTTYVPAGEGAGTYPTETWVGLGRNRSKIFTQDGQLVSDTGSITTSTTNHTVSVHYWDKSWWSYGPVPLGQPRPRASKRTQTCSKATDGGAPGLLTPTEMSFYLSCGIVKADGTATVDGVTAIKLDGTFGQHHGMFLTYWVNRATYLPVRTTVNYGRGIPVVQDDFQWLPPTAANLALLDLPVPPAGFKQVAQTGCISGCNP